MATSTSTSTIELPPLHESGKSGERDSTETGGNAVAVSETLVATADGRHELSRLRAILVITTLTGVNFLNTLGSGILTVSLPTVIVYDIHLEESLLLWPSSVYALAAGCSLLIFGTIGDVVGSKTVWLTGATLYAVFTLAVGLSQSAAQLIAFRAILGLSISMCLPTAVSLTTNSFLPGRWRNMGFACQGMGQPLGYSVGLILGGVFADTIGWRWGFYISAIITALLAACAARVLPPSPKVQKVIIFRRLAHDIDWVGALIISTSLGLLSYELA